MFSLASIATMSACIFLFGLFFSILVNFQYIIRTAEEGVAITVFFEEDATDEQKQEIGQQLEEHEGVANVRYVSADEAWEEAKKQEEKVKQICAKLEEISEYGARFLSSLNSVYDIYAKHLDELDHIVNVTGKRDWTFFSANEQLITENTIILVNVLHKMCKTEMVRKDPKDEELKIANTDAIMTAISDGDVACEHCYVALCEVSRRS